MAKEIAIARSDSAEEIDRLNKLADTQNVSKYGHGNLYDSLNKKWRISRLMASYDSLKAH
jgi:hypothetical protein